MLNKIGLVLFQLIKLKKMQSSEEQIQENIRNVVGSHGEDLVDALLRAINIIKQRFMRVDKFLYYHGP